jgi:hypothetical protein
MRVDWLLARAIAWYRKWMHIWITSVCVLPPLSSSLFESLIYFMSHMMPHQKSTALNPSSRCALSAQTRAHGRFLPHAADTQRSSGQRSYSETPWISEHGTGVITGCVACVLCFAVCTHGGFGHRYHSPPALNFPSGCPTTYTNSTATLVSNYPEIHCGLSNIGNKMD